MKRLFSVVALGAFSLLAANAQILLSGGLTYSQNFDTLASVASSTVPWADNTTLPGWYASRALPVPTAAIPSYRVSGGEANNGSIWSFGTNSAFGVLTERALGSVGSGTPGTNAWGLRIQNDTASAVDNVLISYTGEQWRNGGNVTAQTMPFSYQLLNSPFAAPLSATPTDPAFTPFAGLTFTSPITGASAAALDGNNPLNRTIFSNVLLTGVTLNPGQELIIRWYDINDAGNDHGFGVDDFSISFSSVVPEPSIMTLSGLGLLAVINWRRRK